FAEGCFRNLAKYHTAMETEHLFAYSERQSPSYVMPAMFELTDGCAICEMPLTRTKLGPNSENDKKRGGFLDYWAWYRGVPFAIEVKHSWYSLNGEGMEKTCERWEEADQQLKNVRKWWISEGSDFFMRLNLLILVFWSKGEWSQPNGEKGTTFSPTTHRKEDFDYHGYIIDYLEPEPNLWSYWLLPSNMIQIDDYYYPAVGIFGRLDRMKR
ncbi:MAG: hypothetical protein D6794_10835, partial [Deltaproteobacteria bacterium]